MYIIYQHYGRGRCSGTNERLLKADVGVRSGWRGDYAGEAVRGDGAGIRVNRARERSHTEEERPARPARRSRSMAVPVPSPSTVRQRLNDPAGPPKPHFIGRMPWDRSHRISTRTQIESYSSRDNFWSNNDWYNSILPESPFHRPAPPWPTPSGPSGRTLPAGRVIPSRAVSPGGAGRKNP